MAIPGFQTVMLPLLKSFSDKQPHSIRDFIPPLADHFQLSAEERRELLPSGRQARFDNRVHWAGSYLSQARLLERHARGSLVITDRGRQLLAENRDHLSIKVLERFPEFVQFRSGTKPKGPSSPASSEDAPDGATLEESLEATWQVLRNRLAQELLSRVRSSSPSFFESLVVDLLVAMGYGGSHADAAQVVGRTGDEGIDGVIKQDPLGALMPSTCRRRNGIGLLGVRMFRHLRAASMAGRPPRV